jgi:hypothetical protein
VFLLLYLLLPHIHCSLYYQVDILEMKEFDHWPSMHVC